MTFSVCDCDWYSIPQSLHRFLNPWEIVMDFSENMRIRGISTIFRIGIGCDTLKLSLADKWTSGISLQKETRQQHWKCVFWNKNTFLDICIFSVSCQSSSPGKFLLCFCWTWCRSCVDCWSIPATYLCTHCWIAVSQWSPWEQVMVQPCWLQLCPSQQPDSWQGQEIWGPS